MMTENWENSEQWHYCEIEDNMDIPEATETERFQNWTVLPTGSVTSVPFCFSLCVSRYYIAPPTIQVHPAFRTSENSDIFLQNI